MEFKLRINCDNAAFGDIDSPEFGIELQRILQETANRVTEYPPRANDVSQIRDINGNTIGACFVKVSPNVD